MPSTGRDQPPATPPAAATRVAITPQGPFSLAASAQFLEGFAPAARGGLDDPGDGVLRLAFACEDGWATAGVAVRQDPGGEVLAEITGDADPAPVTTQLARILSLDVDGRGFPRVTAADPVVAGLAERYPGLRPVCFHSPYEAAAWAVIGHRIRITQAARIKAQIAERHGQQPLVAGVAVPAFPDPATLAALDTIAGLGEVKTQRLRAIAQAALDGALDAARLRAMPTGEALAHLRTIPGIGAFSSELILIRGAGHPDVFPTQERRLHDSMTAAYQLEDPDLDRLAAIAQRWVPYRSWVALLLRADREATTGEIARGGRGSASPRRSQPAVKRP